MTSAYSERWSNLLLSFLQSGIEQMLCPQVKLEAFVEREITSFSNDVEHSLVALEPQVLTIVLVPANR